MPKPEVTGRPLSPDDRYKARQFRSAIKKVKTDNASAGSVPAIRKSLADLIDIVEHLTKIVMEGK